MRDDATAGSGSRAGTRRETARGADTRAQIIDAAMALFAEQGYLATSVREIATRCGLTHPALLYHFPSKPSLLMAVLSRRDETDVPGVPLDALEGRALLDRLVDTAHANESQRGLVELFATLSAEATSPSHPAHAYFRARYAALLAELVRAYGELAAAGELRAGVEPAVAARQLVAAMDGLQVQWLLDPSVDMARALSDLVALQLAD